LSRAGLAIVFISVSGNGETMTTVDSAIGVVLVVLEVSDTVESIADEGGLIAMSFFWKLGNINYTTFHPTF
jgi:hypothetical protein